MPVIEIKKERFQECVNIEKESNIYCWSENNILTTLNNYNSLALLINNKIVSFLLYSSVLDEAEILHIVTDNTQKNNGFASKLLSELISILKLNKIKKVSLEVRISNLKAINIYKKAGFKKVSERKGYYKNNETAVILQKDI